MEGLRRYVFYWNYDYTDLNNLLQGCKELVDKFKKPKAWSAFRSSDYGYARLKAYNATHVHMEQISDDKVSKIFLSSITVFLLCIRNNIVFINNGNI